MTDINMSLDDIIKKKRGTRGGSVRGRGNTRGARGGRGGMNRTRTTSEKKITGIKNGGVQQRRSFGKSPRGKAAPSPNQAWKHDMYNKSPVLNRQNSFNNQNNSNNFNNQQSSLVTGKLVISNLEFAVSDNDIKELFSEFGRLLKANVNYDRSGRSRGVAEVLFTNIVDAKRAMNKYNGIPLDGRPMKIALYTKGEVVPRLGTANSRLSGGFNGRTQSAGRGNGTTVRGRTTSAGRGNRGAMRGGAKNTSFNGTPRGRGTRGRGRGAARGGAQRKPVSKEQLDKELDAYSAQTD